MLLTTTETMEKLRELVRERAIYGWNHRDCQHAGCDIYTIDLGEGNVPRAVEWTQAQVERWLRRRAAADALLGSL
jgi:hypothetical protein